MKRLILFLVVIGLTVWAGVEIAQDPGYMLLAYRQWTLETPLWFGILLWFLLFCVFLMISQLWRSVGSLSSKWHGWQARKRLAQANNLTLRAILESLEGHFTSAAKNFDKSIRNAELPLVNLVGAAYCAQQLQQYAQRDGYLEKAIETTPNAITAVKLLKIQWLMKTEAWGEAIYELEQLLHEDPYQKQALLLAQDLYQRLAMWDKLLKISATLRKRKLIGQSVYENNQIKAYAALLQEAAQQQDIKALNSQWLSIPTHYQQTPTLVFIYSQALIQAQQGQKAAELLAETLKKHWDDQLVGWYGQAITPDTEQQLKQAEKWLSQQENNPYLLLTLGRLCIRNNLWGKARSYLEASLQIKALPETHLALAELAESHSEPDKAIALYRKGLQLALNQ